MPLNIPVILGSVRSQRVGPRVAKFVARSLQERGHAPTIIDPIEFPLPLLDKMYKEYPAGQAPPVLEKLAQIIKPADAYVIVSAEYNHSIPPALSNLLDHFLEEYFWRPSAIACYSPSGFGGVRAAMQLRSMLAEMGMGSIPSILPFPKVHELLDENGVPQNDRIKKSTDRFLAELEWHADALKAQRAKGVPY
jgi:NAD(P)H-dependent FMN reductase